MRINCREIISLHVIDVDTSMLENAQLGKDYVLGTDNQVILLVSLQ